jgi:hypothetical protein
LPRSIFAQTAPHPVRYVRVEVLVECGRLVCPTGIEPVTLSLEVSFLAHLQHWPSVIKP